uniref:Integrin subunit alpha 7 n=1 Tax=Sphenodon punctatus TaxID=8508 RepID=A0A8D0H9R9_SPHPU
MPAGALHICLASLLLLACRAFNLDGTETILKDGDKGSFFGFSVALHQQLSPQPVSWLLVGAPQAPALPSQGANRTGGLYACPLTREIDDCWRVPIDEGVDLEKESKENQWLGVTTQSQGPGGKIVVSGHGWRAQTCQHRKYSIPPNPPTGHILPGHAPLCQLKGVPSQAPAELRILFVTNIDSSDPDQLVYKTPEPGEQVPGSAGDVALNSYLGFSVDSGKGITKKHELSFVTGAPRANHTGAVVILRRDNVNRLVPEVVLPGEQLTSSFGYAVAVADLNSDGWTDLIVGAPNFFERKEEIGGAVYVYINQAGRWEGVRPIRLNGSYDSMFGITVTAAGDLNLDGFQDIAVGAPFDGAGKVYIFHGSSLGIVTKPAQVLDGEGVGVQTFGYSLSGGLDIDGNLYPDLLVGSLADTVVLYRSRPVIHISRNVTISPQQIDLESHNSASPAHFVTPPPHPTPSLPLLPPPALEFTFEADGDRRKLGQPLRVSFLHRPPADPEHQYSGAVELLRQHARTCVRATFQLEDSIRDKLRPIPVLVSYNIKHTRAKRQTSAGTTLTPLTPMLNALQPSTQRAEGLVQEGVGVDFRLCEKPPLCVPNQNASHVECELGNPMKQGNRVIGRSWHGGGVTAQLPPPKCLPLCLPCRISEQPGLAPVMARARVIMELPLSVTGVAEPSQLFFSGEVRGESAMRHESDVGSAVRYEVTVLNRGQSLKTLGSAFLNLLWPHEIANGKWLLYPLRLELSAQPGHQTSCSPDPNPLGLALVRGRSRREAKRAEEAGGGPRWQLAYSERRRNVTLDCAQGTARCLLYQCPLYSFDRSAVLTIWGRLWNSTFLEEYPSVTSVDVIVRANITVKSTIRNLVLKGATTQIPVTVYLDPIVAVARGVPWWIILLAVLAGILVLGLLVSILWKLGFFKRARYQESKVPQYHAIKIPRQERQLFREEKSGTITRKDWGPPRPPHPRAAPSVAGGHNGEGILGGRAASLELPPRGSSPGPEPFNIPTGL